MGWKEYWEEPDETKEEHLRDPNEGQWECLTRTASRILIEDLLKEEIYPKCKFCREPLMAGEFISIYDTPREYMYAHTICLEDFRDER